MNGMAEFSHVPQLARFLQSLFRHCRNGGTQPGSGSQIMYNNSNLQRSVTAAVGAVLVSFAVVGAAIGPISTSAPVSATASGQTQSV